MDDQEINPGESVFYRAYNINDKEASEKSIVAQVYAVTGVNGENFDDLMVYPNPTEGSVSYQLPDTWVGMPIEISVNDLSGKTILQKETKDTFGEINLGAQEKGIYILSFESQNNRIYKRVILK